MKVTGHAEPSSGTTTTTAITAKQTSSVSGGEPGAVGGGEEERKRKKSNRSNHVGEIKAAMQHRLQKVDETHHITLETIKCFAHPSAYWQKNTHLRELCGQGMDAYLFCKRTAPNVTQREFMDVMRRQINEQRALVTGSAANPYHNSDFRGQPVHGNKRKSTSTCSSGAVPLLLPAPTAQLPDGGGGAVVPEVANNGQGTAQVCYFLKCEHIRKCSRKCVQC
jgi:hypothetical protein